MFIFRFTLLQLQNAFSQGQISEHSNCSAEQGPHKFRGFTFSKVFFLVPDSASSKCCAQLFYRSDHKYCSECNNMCC